MVNDVIDDKDDDSIFLSDHSRSMREAFGYCITLFRRLEATHGNANENENKDASSITGNASNLRSMTVSHLCCHGVEALHRASEEHRTRRKEAHRTFWSSLLTSKNDASITCTGDNGDYFATDNETSSSQTQRTNPTKAKTPQTAVERMRARFVPECDGNIHTDENNHDNGGTNGERFRTKSLCPDQVRWFRDRFQNRNLPCLITGLDQTPHFGFVNQNWRRSTSGEDPSSRRCNQSRFSEHPRKYGVHRKWFRDELGDNCLVPLRFLNPSGGDQDIGEEDVDSRSQPSLDEDGRAEECATLEVSVREWIDLLEKAPQSRHESLSQHSHGKKCDDNGNTSNAKENKKGPNPTVYYLKDWHLQQKFPGRSFADDCSLYATPGFFGRDLLNPFLARFTRGDYRFCYWGPSQSFTARHSDVMHSFSWSYNVVGTKEWTFFYGDSPDEVCDPFDENNNSSNTKKTFTIRQETGQTIFVPSAWQHRVVNLEETISINHNWITSSNLDLVWDCLRVEMLAVRNELRGWGCDGNDDDNGSDGDGDDGQALHRNMEACENMLRGCLGLDVTGFVLMTLVGLLETVTALMSVSMSSATTANGSPRNETGKEGNKNSRGGMFATQEDELYFDAFRLAFVLRDVLGTEEELLRLRKRLEAVLQSDDMAQSVITMVSGLIRWVEQHGTAGNN
mmetsp:Transcript_19614/g.40180  ORF Transcript_19614/g.40180 Transcript_19614/m.40180 type:complete len:680 (+) Transcript_19614:105-2144(+)|eukprot:CAMPEP_0201153696 /NCGR_PEP_ID=MMETSP0851-20130426/14072_1 /ASSEMBLY_ACC=CAM_ASM_000631 /TAXON_ID=183588 /ORGANISM="Pseudo-nitzschia fraudulenta, Strain WWA7" /LENGTH=679 /DNA_ID=CAMNT_0047430945 /DNA_START=105 /DNA_END=2144 /DNA_ORIENTATION=+